MKFNAAAAAMSAAMFAGVAHAEEAEASQAVVDLPTFTVSTIFFPRGRRLRNASSSGLASARLLPPNRTSPLTSIPSPLAHHHQG